MNDHDQREILNLVFGESSSDGEDDFRTQSIGYRWEAISEVEGLWLFRDFLSHDQQSELLSAIEKEGWFTDASNNQAMRFGDLPSWAVDLSISIKQSLVCSDHATELGKSCKGDGDMYASFPSFVFRREPIFDQLIVNVYQPGEGICAHVDLLRFEDGIAIVSLESPCVMHFTPAVEDYNDNPTRIPVYLNPGSLVLLTGQARYGWKHEINRKPGVQIWEGKELIQKRRTSITLRKLCNSG